MKRTTARWTTMTLAAAALMTLPAAGYAQTTPPAQPPAQTQPQTQPPTPPPAEQQSAQVGSSGQEAAKVHLTAARNSLSQMTQLPAAAQLQGEARTQVSQLITNFNELITTQSDWKTSYTKVQANLSALLAPAPPAATTPAPTGTAGAVGTTGTTEIDPALRAKLMEFRNHLERFEDVAMASSDPARTEPATPATRTPATPTPATPTPEPAGPPDPEPASAAEPQELMSHVNAIESILAAQSAAQQAGAAGTTSPTPGAARSTTATDLTLTQAQLEQLRIHLAELRRLIEK